MGNSPAEKTKAPAKKTTKSIRVRAFPITQSDQTFYLFSMRASQLWSLVQINRRSEDKKEGYQRALSASRVRNIARFISAKGLIPGSIIVSFDKGTFSEATGNLSLPNKKNAGWVIDGQHRLAGAYEAKESGVDPELPVVAFLNLKLTKQISLFVTINKEARSVPSSLYIDLLKHLPHKKTEKEITDERIADITRNLDADEDSPFYQSIAFTRQAAKGEISLVNFARVLRPHLSRQAGVLNEDYASCDIANKYCHPEILRALDTEINSPPFSADYFVAAKLIREALHLMISDIASLAPALLVEAEALRA